MRLDLHSRLHYLTVCVESVKQLCKLYIQCGYASYGAHSQSPSSVLSLDILEVSNHLHPLWLSQGCVSHMTHNHQAYTNVQSCTVSLYHCSCYGN